MSTTITASAIEDSLVERFLTRLRRIKGEDSGTYEIYIKALKCYDDWLRKQGIDAQSATTVDVENFVLMLKEEGYSGNTIKTRHTAVRKMYTMGVETFGVIDESPCSGINLDELNIYNRESEDYRHYVAQDEFEHMRENCGEPYVRNRLVLEIFWQTGVRIGELRNIKLDNVDMSNHRIRVFGEKTNDWRTVHYQPSLNRFMDIWIKEERPLLHDSEYLFPSNRAEQLTKQTFRRIVRESAEEVNEVVGYTQNGKPKRRITPHSLRHGHAVHALKSGIDVRAVQKQLGHKNIDTTMQYLQLVEDDVAEAYQAFNTDGSNSE